MIFVEFSLIRPLYDVPKLCFLGQARRKTAKLKHKIFYFWFALIDEFKSFFELFHDSFYFWFELNITNYVCFSWCSPAPEILLEIMQYQKLWWKDITSDRIAGTWQLLIFDGFVSLYLEGFILTEAPNCLNYDCLNMYKLLSS